MHIPGICYFGLGKVKEEGIYCASRALWYLTLCTLNCSRWKLNPERPKLPWFSFHIPKVRAHTWAVATKQLSHDKFSLSFISQELAWLYTHSLFLGVWLCLLCGSLHICLYVWLFPMGVKAHFSIMTNNITFPEGSSRFPIPGHFRIKNRNVWFLLEYVLQFRHSGKMCSLC